MLEGRPARLKSGKWGATVDGAVEPGDVIEIITQSGARWYSQVERVLWEDTGSERKLVAVARVENPDSDWVRGRVENPPRPVPGSDYPKPLDS